MGKKTSSQEAEVNTERRLSHFDSTLCEGHLSFHFKVGVHGGGKSFISVFLTIENEHLPPSEAILRRKEGYNWF